MPGIKTTIRAVIVLLILILILITVFVGKVDNTPYFLTGHYEATRTELDSLIAVANVGFGSPEAGFARVNITPEISATGVPLAGYGARKGASAEGVHDSLYVKAMAIRVDEELLLFVSADLLIIPPQVADSVSMLLDQNPMIHRNQIYYSATHTHAGVGAWGLGFVGEQFAGPPDPAVPRWLAQRIARAITMAVADLRQASLGSRSLAAPEYVKNRLVGSDGRINDTFSFLVVRQHGGKTAILTSYTAHATTIGSSNMQFSGDYPGYLQRKLETEVADFAMFFAGSVGSHGAVGEGRDFDRARFIGEALADSVIKNIADVELNDKISFGGFAVQTRLPDFHIRLYEDYHLATFASQKLLPLPDTVLLQAARLGDLIWLTTPCDFSGEYALELQALLRSRGLNSVISSFNGGYVGYVIPAKYFYLREYESFVMAWYGPGLGDYFMDLMYRMATALAVNGDQASI